MATLMVAISVVMVIHNTKIFLLVKATASLKKSFFFFLLLHACKFRQVCVFLTKLFQGRDPVLVSVVLTDGGDAATHQGVRQRLHGHLRRIQSTDQGLKTFVGKRRLPAIQLYDPGRDRDRDWSDLIYHYLQVEQNLLKFVSVTIAQKHKSTFPLQNQGHWLIQTYFTALFFSFL